MKQALELGPIVAVLRGLREDEGPDLHDLGGTDYAGFIVMTAIFIPLLLVSTGVAVEADGQAVEMQVATVVLVVIFGGLSVWFNDERFFKMKPTMVYAAVRRRAGLRAVARQKPTCNR